ncbi:IS30 family transposase [Actinoplanes friuliensis]|nr:IS30 family transposase [Actinoplanes friuliensis]
MNNSEACRIVGVGRGTGIYWRYGRTVKNPDGSTRTYSPIMASVQISERFLSEDERVAIADQYRAGASIRGIATALGRQPSTISREIKRNSDPETGKYHPFRAQKRARARRARPKAGKLAADSSLRLFVQQRLADRWSPEQISNVLPGLFPDQPAMRICHETIYQALYRPDHPLTRAAPRRPLRSGRLKRRRRRRADQRTTHFVEAGHAISLRPAEANDRSVAGHWEGDLVLGKNNKSAIGTLIERSTRYAVLIYLPEGHNAGQVRDALIKLFRKLPAGLARTLTWDQGGEMGRHHEFSTATGVPVYFCLPGRPWQRGSNENFNGLLRQYFPKGTDLGAYDAEHLAQIAKQLNDRPRRCLGWTTPAQQLAKLFPAVH